MSLLTTASQTVGPYLSIGFADRTVTELAPPGVIGERVTIQGRVIDGEGQPVNDAMIEIWQANAHGRYLHPDDTREKLEEGAFKGFGRVLSGSDGAFRLSTIKPGTVPGPGGTLQAPHIVVIVFMRGLLKHLVTRIYFPGDPANADDPVLKLVPAARRPTLIATENSGGKNLLEWNVVLQGDNETVFFDC